MMSCIDVHHGLLRGLAGTPGRSRSPCFIVRRLLPPRAHPENRSAKIHIIPCDSSNHENNSTPFAGEENPASYNILNPPQTQKNWRRPTAVCREPLTADDGSATLHRLLISDIMFATYANEYLGCFDNMVESFRLVMDIFKRFPQPAQRAIAHQTQVLESNADFFYRPASIHFATRQITTMETS